MDGSESERPNGVPEDAHHWFIVKDGDGWLNSFDTGEAAIEDRDRMRRNSVNRYHRDPEKDIAVGVSWANTIVVMEEYWWKRHGWSYKVTREYQPKEVTL